MRTYGYTRVKNNHIFVQFDVEQFPTIEKIIAKKHQKIHIFDLYPIAIKNCIQKIIDMADNTTSVIIHIPKMMIDYERVLRKELTNKDHKKVRFSIESKPVEFYIRRSDVINSSSDESLNKIFKVGYSKELKYYKLESYMHLERDRYVLNRGDYDREIRMAFESVCQVRDPELFKDVIIKNFKRNCPKGILTNFKTDDDIWEYLVWSDEEKGGSWYDQSSNR